MNSNCRYLICGLCAAIFLTACDDSTWNPQGGLQQIAILHPLEGDTLNGPTNVQFQAAPFEQLALVELFVDGEEVLNSAQTPFALQLDVLPWADGGAHSLRLRGTAADGIAAESAAIDVQVSAGSAGRNGFAPFDRRLDDNTRVHELVEAPAGWLLGGEKNGSAWLLRLDHKGNTLWERVYGSASGRVRALRREAGGGWLAAGMKDSQPWRARLGAGGNLVEERLYAEDAPGEVRRMLPLPDGDDLLALSVFEGADPDPVFRKVDAAGVTRWRSDPFNVDLGLVERLDLLEDGRMLALIASMDSGSPRSLLGLMETTGASVWLQDTGAGWMSDMVREGGDVILCGSLDAATGPALLRRCDAEGNFVEELQVDEEGLLEIRRLLPAESNWTFLGTRFTGSADIAVGGIGFDQGVEGLVSHGDGGDQQAGRFLAPASGGLLLAGQDGDRVWLLRVEGP